jgi:hypothetical protein
LGSHLACPREVQSLEVWIWERWPIVEREKEREKRDAMVGGLNTPESAPDRTLSGQDSLSRIGQQTRNFFSSKKLVLADYIKTKSKYICI